MIMTKGEELGADEENVSQSFRMHPCSSRPFYHTGTMNTSHTLETRPPGRACIKPWTRLHQTRSCSAVRLGKIDKHGLAADPAEPYQLTEP